MSLIDDRTALIVGAGIGGLAAGIALQRAGWRVRVFERAPNPRELGFALNLAPNAMAALRELGLAERLIAEGALTAVAELRGPNGRLMRRFDVAAARPVGADPSIVALRPALHGALLTAIGPQSLELSSEAVGFTDEGARISLTLANQAVVTGDILVGADGVGSIVRRHLHPDEAPPRPSGFSALRGVAFDVTRHLGGLSAVAYYLPGIEAAMVSAGKNAIYWYVSLIASELPRDRPNAKQLALKAVVAAGADELLQTIVSATNDDDCRFDDLFDRDPIDRWGAGRVTLLGDAAHPMLPHAGQGAAQALEDAVALGVALRPDCDVVPRLRLYETVRVARTRRLVTAGRRIAAATTTRNPIIAMLRNAATRTVPGSLLLRAFFLQNQKDPHLLLR